MSPSGKNQKRKDKRSIRPRIPIIPRIPRPYWNKRGTNLERRFKKGNGKVRKWIQKHKRNKHYIFSSPQQNTITQKTSVCKNQLSLSTTKRRPYRVRITVGGNLVKYDGDRSAPCSDVTTIKTHWNSTISTKQARYLILDITNFYLQQDLDEFVYIFIEAHLLPEYFIKQYNLQDKIYDGKLYAEVIKGMYGLPQAGAIAYQGLVQHLAPYGYEPSTVTPGLWLEKKLNLIFTLVVDDFRIK